MDSALEHMNSTIGLTPPVMVSRANQDQHGQMIAYYPI